jgi:hypothetical protein
MAPAEAGAIVCSISVRGSAPRPNASEAVYQVVFKGAVE